MTAMDFFDENYIDEPEQVFDDSDWLPTEDENGSVDSYYDNYDNNCFDEDEIDIIEDSFEELPPSPRLNISIINQSSDDIIDTIEECYSELDIQRSIIICSTEKEGVSIAKNLEELNHSVGVLALSMIEDDRPLHAHIIRNFDEGLTRVLITSIAGWNLMKNELEVVLPKHNLLITKGLSQNDENRVITRIEDAWMAAVSPSIEDPIWWTKWRVIEPINIDRPYYLISFD